MNYKGNDYSVGVHFDIFSLQRNLLSKFDNSISDVHTHLWVAERQRLYINQFMDWIVEIKGVYTFKPCQLL
jgi:hypothetical protein